MSIKNLSLAGAGLAAALLTSGAASADIVYVDGVGVPNGAISFGVQTDYETRVAQIGDELKGWGVLQSLTDETHGITTYATACTPTAPGCGAGTPILTSVFGGFVLTSIVTTGTDTTLYFSGGYLNYYLQSAGVPSTSGAASADAAISAATSSTLWLSLAAENLGNGTDIPDGTTFIVDLHRGTLGNFTGASGIGFLDVVGGDAAANFDTDAVVNQITGALADFSFEGHANGPAGATGVLPVFGSDDITGNAVYVPEPISLSLFGAGLLAAAAFAPRRKARMAGLA